MAKVNNLRVHLNSRSRCVEIHRDGRWIYEVDLDRCKTTDQALDWIAQIAEKTWTTTRLIRDLARTLQTVFRGSR